MLPLLNFFMMGKIRQCYPLCFLFAPTVFHCKKTSGTLMFFCLNDKKTTVLSLMFSSTTRKYDSVIPYVIFINDKLQQCYPFRFFLGWKKYDSDKLKQCYPFRFFLGWRKYDSVTPYVFFGRTVFYSKKRQCYILMYFFIIGRKTTLLPNLFFWPDYFIAKNLWYPYVFLFLRQENDSVIPYVFFHNDKIRQCYPLCFLS